MNAFAGIRPKGGRNPTPLAFSPAVCSGGYLFSSGGPTPTTPPPPRQFLPCRRVTDGQTDGQTSCHGIVRAMHTRRAVTKRLQRSLRRVHY